MAQNTPDQTFPPLLIRACAGSGKTFKLSNRFITLLAAGESPNKILATTFTRKAAGEILDRVFTRLAKAALDEQDAKTLGKELEQSGWSCKKAKELVRILALNQHHLTICTLDSFFFRVALTFGMDIGLAPGWGIASETANRIVQQDSIRALLQDEDHETLTTLIRLLGRGEQARSVHQKLLAEVPALFELYRSSQASAWKSLEVPKAPTDELVQQAIATLAELKAPLTKEGKENKLFRNSMNQALEAASNFNWTDFIEVGMVKNLVRGENKFNRVAIPDDVVAALRPLLTKARAVVLGRLNDQTLAQKELAIKYAQIYEQHRTSSHTLDFSDIRQRIVNGAVMNRIDNLYFRLDQSIHHVLLDEFQDTSGAEWALLEPMVGEILAKSGHEYSFFCVGDVKQAIYGFRGGVAEIFDTLKQRWKQIHLPDQEILTRRCGASIVECVNKVFTSLPTNKILEAVPQAVQEWAGRFEAHEALGNASPSYAQLQFVDEARFSLPEDSDNDEISSEIDGHVAQLVHDLVSAKPELTIGILVRRRQRIKPIIRALSAARFGIRASEEGGNPLTDSTAVMAILSLLTMVDHPKDLTARYHVANSALGQAVGFVDFSSDTKAIELSAQISRDIFAQGYGPLVHNWYRLIAAHLDDRDQRRVLQLVELGYAYSLNQLHRPSDFVEMVENEAVEDPNSANVRVMTIHKSKGLEFDVVILADLDGQIFGGLVGRKSYMTYHDDRVAGPSQIVRSAKESIRALDPRLMEMSKQMINEQAKDALSVLYVAMTRPRHALYMFAKKSKPKGPTYSGILRSALFDSDRDSDCGADSSQDCVEFGNLNWIESFDSKKSSVVASARALSTINLTVDENRRLRGLLREVPSLLPFKSLVDLSDVLRLSTPAASKGTLIHRWFQLITWLEESVPTLEEALKIGHSLGIPASDEEEAFKSLLVQCKTGQICDILSKASYEPRGFDELKVHNEFKFAVREGNAIVSGSVDRLVLGWKNGVLASAEIIDFKTDKIDVKGISNKVEFYRPQIEAYSRAIAQRFNLKPEQITKRLVFTSCGVVSPL